MATTVDSFERQLKLATADLEPAEINRALAAFAKRELRAVIASGQASTNYERYVNNVQAAPEESVIAPGPIRYEFVNWPTVIREALDELRKRVPRKSGRYAGGFLVLVGGRPVVEYKTIPAMAEVVVMNVRPYTRKMEVGANGSGRRHFEGAKNALARRYRDVFSFDFRFLNVSNGIHPGVPYILKRSAGKRKDRQAGMPITYPSIIINAA